MLFCGAIRGGVKFWIEKKYPPPYSNNLIIAGFKELKTRINCGVFALPY
jgi:hypothetical protein